MQFLGIDIGTQSTKGVLVGEDGCVVARAARPHTVDYPHPGWAEQDGERIWWGDTVRVIRHLLASEGVQSTNLAGIAVSGLFPALLPLDRDGKAIRPAILYSDNRAEEERIRFQEEFHLQLSGDALTPKLVWLREHEPDRFQRIRYIFSAHNYPVYRLCGRYCIDYKVASTFGGLLDLNTLEWNREILDCLHLSLDQMPGLCSPVDVAGSVTREAAQMTGLPAGLPVLVGSGDSLMSFIGSAVLRRGEALVSLGTTGWMGVLTADMEEYLHNPKVAPSASPYVLAAYMLSLGSALNWVQERFQPVEVKSVEPGKPLVLEKLEQEAARVAPGCDGVSFLPYFQGHREHTVNAPGAGVIYGLRLSHGSAHIYRALLEAFGYELRLAMDDLGQDGIQVDRVVCAGSGALSGLWRQILCDITGKTWLMVPGADTPLGNACLVAYALGIIPSLSQIVTWLPEPIIHRPGLESESLYRQAFGRYTSLRADLSRY
jgi:xylulokinase